MQIARIDTWLTSPCLSEDGWTEVESFLFVRLTSDDGYEWMGRGIHAAVPRCLGFHGQTAPRHH